MLSDTLKEKIESLPAILSIREIADFFSVAYPTAYRVIREGKLPSWKADGYRYVARSDLLKFCSKNSNL
jgi:excisionase family DNA binding protein